MALHEKHQGTTKKLPLLWRRIIASLAKKNTAKDKSKSLWQIGRTRVLVKTRPESFFALYDLAYSALKIRCARKQSE